MDDGLNHERLVIHRELQLLRAYSTRNRKYVLERLNKLNDVTGKKRLNK
jgi:hypothetical protein